MNYQEFKDYLITHLWKQGDAVVIAALDTIIQTAENELNRTFKVEDRTEFSEADAISNLVELPSDFREMRVVSNSHCSEMKYYIPSKFFALQNRVNGGTVYDAYTIINKDLALIGNITIDTPLHLTLVYYMNVPNFKTADTSWMADDYLDVYTYCVLKHSAPFLREDERLAVWGALLDGAMSSALTENDDRKFAGSPLKLHFPSRIR